jgi:hypothetical protein
MREPGQAALFKRVALCMPVVLVAVSLMYPTNREQRGVQAFVLGRTTADQSIFVPPALNPVFRRDAVYFWYNADLISGAYEEYCRGTQDCPGNKLALDDHRWEDSPPAFVLLELPAYFPYHWNLRESFYRPTEIPRLWEREEAARSVPSAERSAPSQ